MLKLLLPVVLLAIGLGAGVFAGKALRPAPEPTEAAVEEKAPEIAQKEDNQDKEYAKLNNQFVIPLVENGSVSALVVMALSIEVTAGQRDLVFAHEPKIRDSFLQVMFDHANIGGFRGDFTRNENLAVLRRSLKDVATRDLGKAVTDVLILEIARQDYN